VRAREAERERERERDGEGSSHSSLVVKGFDGTRKHAGKISRRGSGSRARNRALKRTARLYNAGACTIFPPAGVSREETAKEGENRGIMATMGWVGGGGRERGRGRSVYK
jgi:hypothetical protein